MKMKHIFSVLTVCLVIVMVSCGKGGDDCSADYVGDWTGEISCSGQDAATITVSISQIMGDSLSMNLNGEQLEGVLNGCDLTFIPTEIEIPIFGNLTITGTGGLIGDDLTITQMRAAGGESETCTFIGKK